MPLTIQIASKNDLNLFFKKNQKNYSKIDLSFYILERSILSVERITYLKNGTELDILIDIIYKLKINKNILKDLN